MSHPVSNQAVRRVPAPGRPATSPCNVEPAQPCIPHSGFDWSAHGRPASRALPLQEPGPFQDIPGWIWRAFLSAWAALFGLFLLFFTTNASATFMVVISALFAVMAFGLPMTLAAQSRRMGGTRKKTIDTYTGPMSAGAAAAQIVLIPVGAVLGLIAFIALAK